VKKYRQDVEFFIPSSIIKKDHIHEPPVNKNLYLIAKNSIGSASNEALLPSSMQTINVVKFVHFLVHLNDTLQAGPD
jgi:hypothetical protein